MLGMKYVFERQRIENWILLQADDILSWIQFLNNRHIKILLAHKNQLNNPPAYEVLGTCK